MSSTPLIPCFFVVVYQHVTGNDRLYFGRTRANLVSSDDPIFSLPQDLIHRARSIHMCLDDSEPAHAYVAGDCPALKLKTLKGNGNLDRVFRMIQHYRVYLMYKAHSNGGAHLFARNDWGDDYVDVESYDPVIDDDDYVVIDDDDYVVLDSSTVETRSSRGYDMARVIHGGKIT
jgi:hypothetical protein